MNLSMRVQINSHTRQVKEWGDGFADEFAYAVAQEAAENARKLTKPGIGPWGLGGGGPGPHPHATKHWDTGNLMRSINVYRTRFGFFSTATVTTHLDYGLYLEKGWHAANGAFYVYPWLKPSMDKATQNAMEIVKMSVWRWYGQGTAMGSTVKF